MSDTTAAAKKQPPQGPVATPKDTTASHEVHGISMLLVSPSDLGRAFTQNDPAKIAAALAALPLSPAGTNAATNLMMALSANRQAVEAIANTLVGAYTGSEPHPNAATAVEIIQALRALDA